MVGVCQAKAEGLLRQKKELVRTVSATPKALSSVRLDNM